MKMPPEKLALVWALRLDGRYRWHKLVSPFGWGLCRIAPRGRSRCIWCILGQVKTSGTTAETWLVRRARLAIEPPGWEFGKRVCPSSTWASVCRIRRLSLGAA